MAPSVTLQPLVRAADPAGRSSDPEDETAEFAGLEAAAQAELALLEALTHEVRTP